MARTWGLGRIGPIVAVVLAAVAAATGCGGDDSDTAAGDSSNGRDLYAQNCAVCHGDDLRGTAEGPSHLSMVYEPGHHPDESFRAAIANGSQQHHWNFGDMPPVEGLDDEQVDAIIAYIRDVQSREGFEPYPPE